MGSTLQAVKRGLGYSLAFVDDRYYLPLVALIALRWVGQPVWLWMLSYVLVHSAYVIYVGGDFYSGQRFYVAMLPIVYLLLGRIVHVRRYLGDTRVWRRIRRHPVAVAAIVAVLGGLAAFGGLLFEVRSLQRGPYSGEIRPWSEPVDENVRYMRWLKGFVQPGESMVLGDIGAAGFFADLRVVDVYGVVDPEIANQKVATFGKGKPGHEKVGTRDYVLRSRPKYVKWGYVPGDLHSYGYYVFTEFPRGLQVQGLWVRDELTGGEFIPETAIHFDPGELAFWGPEGDAFERFPSLTGLPGQSPINYAQGHFVNTFSAGGGNRATGRLTSPPIALVGDKMVVHVGGGRDIRRLRVSLVVEGNVVRSATGHDCELLGRRVWDIEEFRGRSGRIEIVDDSKEAGGGTSWLTS